MNSRPSSHRLRLRGSIAALCALVALGTVGAGAVPASAAPVGKTYYVDCGARTAGSGTAESTPWNSLARPNGHGPFSAGDRILLKRGSVCTGSLHPSGSGTAAAPIVIGAYGKGALPTINGNTRDQTGTVSLVNQAHVTIQDLHITNHGKAKEVKVFRSGVLIRNDGGGRLAGVTVQRLKIDSVVSNLAFLWQDPREFGGISVITRPQKNLKSGFDGLKILHNTISKVGRTGIMVTNQGSKATDTKPRIGYNTINRARGDSIVLRNASDARIDHNVSANGADFWPCKQCGPITPATANAAIWPSNTKNAVVEYNEVYGEHKLGGDGVGIDADVSAKGTIIQYNYVHDNEGGGILFCGSNNTTARFNILENNQRAAFVFIGSIPATNTKIYNNTVYSKRGNQARVVHTQGDRGGKGISFFNNLIFNLDDSGYFVWPTTPKSRTNTYIGVHGIGEPADAGKGYVNPGVRRPGTGGNGFGSVNGYKVTKNVYTMAGSPIPGSVKKDFFGKAINPKKPPRGAAG